MAFTSSSNHSGSKTSRLASAWPLMVLAVIVLCGLSFYGGTKFHSSQPTNTVAAGAAGPNATQNGSGTSGAGGRRYGGQRPTIGQVTAISPTSISVSSNGGATVTLAITSSTQITNAGQSASVSDIQTGDTVLLMKSTADTSQAARILINPTFGGGGGSGTGTGSGSTAPSSQDGTSVN